MVHSKLLCAEAKRRMSRFYAYAKLLWSKTDWTFNGQNESGESLCFSFKQARTVIFAGQTPPPSYFIDHAEHHGCPTNGDFDAVAFIPGRTSYWFFDLIIYIPEERRLYAITTSSVVGTWLKDLNSRYGPMQIAQQKDDGILQPAILLDQWKDALKKAGLTKVIVKCCVLKTIDLMMAAGYNVDNHTGLDETATTEGSGDASKMANIAQLAKHLEAAAVIKDDD